MYVFITTYYYYIYMHIVDVSMKIVINETYSLFSRLPNTIVYSRHLRRIKYTTGAE